MKRISRVVTKSGDKGQTTLGDGSAIAKHDLRVHCMGEVDELNSAIGYLKTFADCAAFIDTLEFIQQRLFDIGGELCLPDKTFFDEKHIVTLDESCKALNDELPPLTEFILPGTAPADGWTHMCRGICRRAERALWQLADSESLNIEPIQFLNRLSDWLFIVSRTLSRNVNTESEKQWNKQKPSTHDASSNKENC